MNKSTQREVQKAIAFASSEPGYAAATLAPLMRACSSKVLAELVTVMDKCGLRGHMDVVNGCYVAKQA